MAAAQVANVCSDGPTAYRASGRSSSPSSEHGVDLGHSFTPRSSYFDASPPVVEGGHYNLGVTEANTWKSPQASSESDMTVIEMKDFAPNRDVSFKESGESNELSLEHGISDEVGSRIRQVNLFSHHFHKSMTAKNTFIRLTRASSSSTERILDSKESDLNETADIILGEPGTPTTFDNSPDNSKKRSKYLQKVRAMFKPRSTTTLNNNNIQDSTIPEETKPRKSNLRKTRSQTLVSGGNDETPFEELSISGANRARAYSTITFEGTVHDLDNSETNDDVNVHADLVKKHQMISKNESNTVVQVLRVPTKEHTLHRSYSLLGRDIDHNDSSRVSFTRMASLRMRRLHVSLLHHFATILPPDENNESRVIKDATHIQPLDSGESLVTDILSNNIIVFDAQGLPKITFAVESGSEPWATCLTPVGGLAVTLKRQGCVSLWSTTGQPISEFGQNILSGPTGILCDNYNRFIVADEESNSVCVFSAHGELLNKFSNKTADSTTPKLTLSRNQYKPLGVAKQFFKHPRHVCLTNTGQYVIADSANHSIKIFDSHMNLKTQFGEYGRADSCFRFPYGVACDEEGNLYVADHFNNRVSLFSPEGEFIEHLLTFQDNITRPKSVAVRYPLLYLTYGCVRASKVSVFQLRK